MTPGTDRAAVTELLGRQPQGDFEVVVRRGDGSPLVIANAPLLDDGTPMPTRYWLVGKDERVQVGRLESDRGVVRAEAAVDPDRLAATHAAYAAGRDALIPEGHHGPRPYGGVGGTRRGVKCLHAHYAHWLAGGDDPVGEWVARQLTDEGHPTRIATDGPTVAAIDCGTNSTRLLIADRGPDGSLRTLRRTMRITRLGQGVDATGRLDPEALARTLDVLAAYRLAIDTHGVTDIRLTATSAARDAHNRDDFFGPVAEEMGVEPELLTGAEEAALSFRGATADLIARPGTYLVVDVGGGSTELAVGEIAPDGHIQPGGAESVDLGCVRITERFLAADPVSDTELAAATDHCAAVLAGVMQRLPEAREATTLLGLAGTVSVTASVDLGLAVHDRHRLHHHEMSAERIRAITADLAGMSTAQRGQVPGMEPGRVGVVVGGLVVVNAVLAATGHDRLVVSEADILDGLAMSLLT